MRSEPMRPRVRLRSIRCRDLTDAEIIRLHRLANRLMAEDEEHFRVHAATNDVVHVFECAATGEVVGFQFWKTMPLGRPRTSAIVGGKLRIAPEFRGGALHLLSGLRFFLRTQLSHPRTRFYRLSMASIFGFDSITAALAEYRFFDPSEHDADTRLVSGAFDELARESGFRIDDDGRVFVGIHMTPETLDRYPAAYFARPAARAYALRNPGFRTNGCYLAFWFRFSPRNLRALVGAIARKRARFGRRARARS